MPQVIRTPDGKTDTYLGLSDAVAKAKELCGDELVDFIVEEAISAAWNERYDQLAPIQRLLDGCCDDYVTTQSVQKSAGRATGDNEAEIHEHYQSMLTEIRDIIDERIMPLIEGRLNRIKLNEAVNDIRKTAVNW